MSDVFTDLDDCPCPLCSSQDEKGGKREAKTRTDKPRTHRRIKSNAISGLPENARVDSEADSQAPDR